MGQDVKFLVMHRNEQFAAEMRAMLAQFDNVKIVAELDEPALLTQAVKQFPVDIVLIDLDPSPETILPIMAEVVAVEGAPAVFAVSESTDGPLILKVMRLGAREFLPKPIDVNALQDAMYKVSLQRAETVHSGKLITIMGTAGGVGSTMLATNLAIELASGAERGVTIVDLDYRFGQVATFLDVEPKFTLADLCSSPEQLEPHVMGRAFAKHSSGVNVLARPNNFAEAETITAAACVGVLSNLMNMNDYVVADGPTRYDNSARSLLALSDVNLLVVQLLIPCVRNAMRIIESLRETGYNLDRTKLICNRVGRDSGHISEENVSETLNMPVYATIPDDWDTVSGAINLGEPLRIHSPKSRVRQSIEEIAERLHEPEAQSDDKDTRKKGLIGRIFAPS
jgi:pilus assembly protein CpaE